MKLWQLERGQKFIIDDSELLKQEFTLERIDGAYSICYDNENNLIHLSASTPVITYDEINLG